MLKLDWYDKMLLLMLLEEKIHRLEEERRRLIAKLEYFRGTLSESFLTELEIDLIRYEKIHDQIAKIEINN
ncbi:hypothetical protein [Paraclostridium dentum]|uniref:hypothetical protein n=1 Tax=Paraclostridium dentum TaxID=2662455 RepID=UPI003464C00D